MKSNTILTITSSHFQEATKVNASMTIHLHWNILRSDLIIHTLICKIFARKTGRDTDLTFLTQMIFNWEALQIQLNFQTHSYMITIFIKQLGKLQGQIIRVHVSISAIMQPTTFFRWTNKHMHCSIWLTRLTL